MSCSTVKKNINIKSTVFLLFTLIILDFVEMNYMPQMLIILGTNNAITMWAPKAQLLKFLKYM